MPILTLSIMQGQSAAQKAALLKAVSDAVVEGVGAPLRTVRIVLSEASPQDVIVGGELGKEMARADIMLIAGRTEEQKASLIAAVNKAICASIGISNQDVRVILTDVPAINLGVAGGVTAKSTGR
jgi:4-oxalocrotonate tautomerase